VKGLLKIGRDGSLCSGDGPAAQDILDRAFGQAGSGLEGHQRAVPLPQRRLDVFSMQSWSFHV
jgi:hypothetical protein